ncbi:MAG: hypothetical protein ACLT9J_10825 [Agathobacter rectalis]
MPKLPKQTTSDDFATVLADSTKAIENNQNTISTSTAVSDYIDRILGQELLHHPRKFLRFERAYDSIFEDAANTCGVSSIIPKSVAIKTESGLVRLP